MASGGPPSELNPYASNGAVTHGNAADGHARPQSTWRVWGGWGGWMLAYLYPLWLVGSFYLVWLVAWFELGHRPRPMLDDPKSIEGLTSFLYYLPGLLLMCFPIWGMAGAASAFASPWRSRSAGPLLLCAYIVLAGLCITLLRGDPHQIVEWWFD